MDFRGASAEAVDVLTEQLRGAAADSATRAAATADSLFSVSQTMRAEPALRRYVTDSTVPGEAKAGVAKEIFGGKIDETALDVLTAAVQRRWTHSTDFADALERLAEVAAVLSAGDKGAQLSEELFALRRVVDANPALRDALSDPARSSDDKAGLLGSLLDGKVQPATLRLARQALQGSYGTVSAALSSYRTLAGEIHGEGVATVYAAAPLSDEQSKRLSAALARQYGRPIHLDVVVDPSIIGGLRVEIGDDVIDGAIASRLDEARRRLAS